MRTGRAWCPSSHKFSLLNQRRKEAAVFKSLCRVPCAASSPICCLNHSHTSSLLFPSFQFCLIHVPWDTKWLDGLIDSEQLSRRVNWPCWMACVLPCAQLTLWVVDRGHISLNAVWITWNESLQWKQSPPPALPFTPNRSVVLISMPELLIESQSWIAFTYGTKLVLKDRCLALLRYWVTRNWRLVFDERSVHWIREKILIALFLNGVQGFGWFSF